METNPFRKAALPSSRTLSAGKNGGSVREWSSPYRAESRILR